MHTRAHTKTKNKTKKTFCVIKYGGARAPSAPRGGVGVGWHHSDEIRKEIENSLLQYDF